MPRIKNGIAVMLLCLLAFYQNVKHFHSFLGNNWSAIKASIQFLTMEIQTSKKIYGDDARLRTTSRFYMGFKLAFLLLFTIAFVFQPVSGLSLSRAFMDPENALFPESNSQKMSELDSAEQNQQQLQVEDSLESEAAQGCAVYDNDPIHALMDRICELCHDMFSHQQPNTRAECRSDCFRSNSFKRCLRLFKPVDTNGANGQQARKRRIRFLASTQQ